MALRIAFRNLILDLYQVFSLRRPYRDPLVVGQNSAEEGENIG